MVLSLFLVYLDIFVVGINVGVLVEEGRAKEAKEEELMRSMRDSVRSSRSKEE